MKATMITNGWVSFSDIRAFEAFKEMSDEEKRIYHFIDNHPLPTSAKVRIYEKGKNIVIAEQVASWMFANNKFFISRKFDTLATITPTRVFCNSRAGNTLCILLGITQEFRITKPLIRAMVMKGKSAYDEYAKKNEVEIRAQRSGLCYNDLKTFTTDVRSIVERFEDDCNHELRDLIQQAKCLNKIVKHTWSDRKIHDMHMKWTEEIQAIKCRNCSTDPIWDIDVIMPDNITWLNTERQVADEGAKMHHCIYTNYWYRIKRKEYVALHISEANPKDDYTIGFRIEYDYRGEASVILDQCYKAYNKPVSEEQKSYAESLKHFVYNLIMIHQLEGECKY
jgi:hypothetical protein